MSSSVRTSDTGSCGSARATIRRIDGTQRTAPYAGTNDQILGNVEDQRVIGHLLIRQVDLRLAVTLQAADPDVAHDPGNRAFLETEGESPANRVGAGPVAAYRRTG